MTKAFAPMLSAKFGNKTVEDLVYPLMITPKLDGIRCVLRDGTAYSRTLKRIPNTKIRTALESLLIEHPEFEGFDGELMVTDSQSKAGFAEYNTIQSVIMSESHPLEDFYVFAPFDSYAIEGGYAKRLKEVTDTVMKVITTNPGKWNLSPVPTGVVQSGVDALKKFEQLVAHGFEGIMFRDPDGLYKYGRSTFKEQGLVKMKPFEDHEATIVGFDEQMTNTNEKEVDELGHSKRSSKKEGLVPAETLGCLVVESLDKSMRYEVGTGFTAAERKELWDNKESYLGKFIKVRYMTFGAKDKPRHATFLGFRHPDDMSA